MKNKIILQKEIDNISKTESITIEQEIKNKIILFRNELNIIEKDVEKFSEKNRIKILKKLEKMLQTVFTIRQF